MLILSECIFDFKLKHVLLGLLILMKFPIDKKGDAPKRCTAFIIYLSDYRPFDWL